MEPDPSPDPAPAPAPAADEASTALAALSLRAAADLPPDFAAPEIDEDDDDEGYATAASRGGSSTAAWKEEMEGLEEDAYGDAGPPSPSSSGYAGERGSNLASSGGIEEEPDAATPPHAPGAEGLGARQEACRRGPRYQIRSLFCYVIITAAPLFSVVCLLRLSIYGIIHRSVHPSPVVTVDIIK
jgi:hypothetical protein